MSACVNARSVCVRTFPRAPLLNPSAVMEMSSGASTIATMSYSPSVQKESLTVAPHFFAISLKASVRFTDFVDSLVSEGRKHDVGCHCFSPFSCVPFSWLSFDLKSFDHLVGAGEQRRWNFEAE